MLRDKIRVECNNNIISGDPGNMAAGSTFFFTIPYSPVQEPGKVLLRTKKDFLTFFQKKDMKILIVEDDNLSEKLLLIFMNEISDNVSTARSGTAAIEACRKNTDIDLILMDMKMPGMNGYEATREIRKFNKNVTIIAQTAYCLNGDMEKALDAGCDDYISKPINHTSLIRIIGKHFPNIRTIISG